MCACAAYSFTNLEIRLDTITFISCSTLIFAQYLIFTTANSEKPDSQRHNVTENIFPFISNCVLPQAIRAAIVSNKWWKSITEFAMVPISISCCSTWGDLGTQPWNHGNFSVKSGAAYKLVNILIT